VKARRTASIQDVASAASVSTATVSRVLNNPTLVAPATAERVHEAIRQLGYKPNLFAQGLMTSKSHVLGIALPDIHGEFYSELLRGADEQAASLGYHLLVSPIHRPNNGRREPSLVFGLIDGLALMVSEPSPDLLDEARRSRLPLVLLDADLPDQQFDSVLVDNASGTTEAIELLIRAVGPARCYFVGGPPENYDTQERARVFRQNLQFHKHTPREDQLAFGRYSVEWGREWAHRRCQQHGPNALRGQAVLAGNDEIALGIVQGAFDFGVGVPNDLRVIGFDDTRLAQLVRPMLTTVRVPLAEVGASAVRMLARRIEQPDTPPACVRLPTKLITRDSSGPA
jgi:LacI family transcriptional regulator